MSETLYNNQMLYDFLNNSVQDHDVGRMRYILIKELGLHPGSATIVIDWDSFPEHIYVQVKSYYHEPTRHFRVSRDSSMIEEGRIQESIVYD